MSYKVIKLNQLSVNSIVMDNIKSNPNVYAVGFEFLEGLKGLDLPIKNRDIAIRNILSFLRWVDGRLKSVNGTVIPIDVKILIEYFNRNEYLKYMKILNDLKVLTNVTYLDGSYYSKDNKVSKQYRVFNQYMSQDICIVVFNNSFVNKLKVEMDKSFNTKMVSTIKRSEIDIVSAIQEEIKYTKGSNALRCRLNVIFSLYEKRYVKYGNKVMRVYHSFTTLSKISRKHLSCKGYKFNNIDIKNCQPLLLCYLLKSLNMLMDDNYLNDCESGRIYERFITDEMDRNEVKVDLYTAVYFDFKPSWDVAKKFKELYPLTYRSLEILDKDTIKLASKLQNIEAEIFNKLNPIRSKYYYTLFDAVYFTDPSDIGELCLSIINSFKRYDIVPRLSINEDTEFDTDIIKKLEEIVK